MDRCSRLLFVENFHTEITSIPTYGVALEPGSCVVLHVIAPTTDNCALRLGTMDPATAFYECQLHFGRY